MTEFAERINSMATETFADMQRIEEEYKNAVAAEKAAGTDPVKRAKAKADYIAAEETRRKMKQNYPGKTENTLASLRKEYEASINKDFAAKAEDVDMKLVTLLESGILSANEYRGLLETALESGNMTSARLITRAARTAAEESEKKFGYYDDRTKMLRYIANFEVSSTANQLRVFDALADIIRRSVKNMALQGYWNQLSAELLEKL